MKLENAILQAGKAYGGMFTRDEAIEFLKANLPPGNLPSKLEVTETLKRMAEKGALTWAGVRMVKGRPKYRLFMVRTQGKGKAYREFCAFIEREFGKRRARFHLDEVASLAKGEIGQEVTDELVQRWLVRMIRERRIMCHGVNRRHELQFSTCHRDH